MKNLSTEIIYYCGDDGMVTLELGTHGVVVDRLDYVDALTKILHPAPLSCILSSDGWM